MKRFAVWLSLFLLVLSPVCLGADSTGTINIQDLMRQANAMRQNIAWMTVGLDELLKSKGRGLGLTPKQKKQILPIMQGLVRKKLILLKVETQPAATAQSDSPQRGGDRQARQRVRQTQDQTGQQRLQNVGLKGNQAGLQKLQELIIFGNAQADKVDAVLTPGQVSFIDNLDFQPEKYGFTASRQFSNGGSSYQGGTGGSGGQTFRGTQGGQTGRNWAGRNPGTNGARQQQILAGRTLLIKINNEVMKLLRQ